jgi:ATP-dependent helicase HrpA
VIAFERATLYGLIVYNQRRVSYASHDPKIARELFIRAALVDGELDTQAPFFQHNRRLVREIRELEHKTRRPDVLVDDELIFAFYDQLLPGDVHSAATFDKWRKLAEAANPNCCSCRATS